MKEPGLNQYGQDYFCNDVTLRIINRVPEFRYPSP